jgi:hypothetical protein
MKILLILLFENTSIDVFYLSIKKMSIYSYDIIEGKVLKTDETKY